MLTLTYPAIDPVLLEIGPFAIRWYALSYIAGILLAWRYMIWLARQSPVEITKNMSTTSSSGRHWGSCWGDAWAT